MNIKIRKRDALSPAAYWACSAIVIGLSVVLLVITILQLHGDFSGESIGALFASGVGFLGVFSLIFLILGIFMVINYFREEQVGYAVLTVKGDDLYEGRQITALIFDPEMPYANEKTQRHCACYAEGDCDLQIGKRYMIKYKPYNWQITYVFGGQNQSAGANTAYVDDAGVFGLAAETGTLTQTGEETHAGGYEQPGMTAGGSGTTQMKPVPLPYSVPQLEKYGILQEGDCKVIHTNSDNLQIQKLKISVPQYIDLANVRYCKLRTPFTKNEAEQFFLTDENMQLIYRFREDLSLKQRFIVSDYKDRLIAVIEEKRISVSREHIIRMVGQPAVSLKPVYGMQMDYEVAGCDIKVLGGVQSSIWEQTICDREGNMLARVSLPSDRMVGTGSMDFVISPSAENSILLMMIAFCISETNEDMR